MTGRPFMVILGVASLLGASACRSQPQSWPSETADLTGQIVEARMVSTLGGFTAGGSAGGNIQRLHIRVIGSHSTTPGAQAFIGVDGITQLLRRDASASDGDRPELEGAFVRVWFRGAPRKATPVELVAMARVVAIDSLASPETRR
jgi:hypothetical protein